MSTPAKFQKCWAIKSHFILNYFFSKAQKNKLLGQKWLHKCCANCLTTKFSQNMSRILAPWQIGFSLIVLALRMKI